MTKSELPTAEVQGQNVDMHKAINSEWFHVKYRYSINFEVLGLVRITSSTKTHSFGHAVYLVSREMR